VSVNSVNFAFLATHLAQNRTSRAAERDFLDIIDIDFAAVGRDPQSPLRHAVAVTA
jgi:hypothetical protein